MSSFGRSFTSPWLRRSDIRSDVRFDLTRQADALERITGIVAVVALLSLVATWAFGLLAAGLFILATMGLIVLTPRASAADLVRFLPLLLLPLLAMASAIWSDAPARTLRAALQLMLTCLAAIIICRRLGASALIMTLFVALLGVVALILPGVPSSLVRHTALGSALLGSKNQVGFAAQVLIASGLAILVDKQQPGLARIATLPVAALALLVLALSQSAGAAASLAITLVTFVGLVIFGKVSFRARIGILCLLAVLLIVALIFMSDIEAYWAAFRTDVLKKDATLTGRTYLWDFAARLSAQRPWLGHGYYAFWRPGNIDAEGLWRWGGIASRSGFNFHNAFVEMKVDLGLVGQALFVLSCVGIAVMGFARQLLRPSVPMAFLLSFVVAIYVRSYAESGLIAPFSLATLLWIGTAVYASNSVPAAAVETLVPSKRRERASRSRSREPRGV